MATQRDDKAAARFVRTDHGKYSVLKFLEYRLDFRASRELKNHFAECKKRYISRLVLDLSSCNFLSSEGIGFLLYMWQFYRNDGVLYIVLSNPGVLELLKDCSLHTEFGDHLCTEFRTAEDRITGKKDSGPQKDEDDQRSCPECKGTNIGVYDRGLKGVVRMAKGKKKRLVCRDCYLVWRAR